MEVRAEILDAVSEMPHLTARWILVWFAVHQREGRSSEPCKGASCSQLPTQSSFSGARPERGASLIEHCSSLLWLTKNISIPGLVPNLEEEVGNTEEANDIVLVLKKLMLQSERCTYQQLLCTQGFPWSVAVRALDCCFPFSCHLAV